MSEHTQKRWEKVSLANPRQHCAVITNQWGDEGAIVEGRGGLVLTCCLHFDGTGFQGPDIAA